MASRSIPFPNSLSPGTAVVLTLVYCTILGAGMFWSYHVDGYVFGVPEMVRTLWPVEVVLTIFVIWVSYKFASWKQVGFAALRKNHLLWWFAVPFVVVIISWVQIIPNLLTMDQDQFALFALVAFTMALVGFSEELMHRGIVLRAFLRRYPVWISMLASALFFSLMHLVNFASGLLPEEVIAQLVVTFIFGLFAAPLALLTNNLWPLIILHWQWNLLLFATELSGGEVIYPIAMLIFQPLMIVPLWIIVLRKPKESFDHVQ